VSWRASTPQLALQQRGELLRLIRDFFYQRQVLEVATPVLGGAGVSDVHLQNLVVASGRRHYYLQTSPEYAMKRLLASGSGAIYQLGPVFRGLEIGARHNIEFTMLEWYRPGMSLTALMDELVELLVTGAVLFDVDLPVVKHVTYASLFRLQFGVDPHDASLPSLRQLAVDGGVAIDHIREIDDEATRNDYLDVLFSALIEPQLQEPTVVFDFPASQAALARLYQNDAQQVVAERAELYWLGCELANGYAELTDGVELRKRMLHNNLLRQRRHLPEVSLDEKLLAAMPELPACAGVAVGFDRLLMLLTGQTQIDQVISFTAANL
jgi:lysyl-tRNA synthetase class 2